MMLRPGNAALTPDWREISLGAAVALDAACRQDVRLRRMRWHKSSPTMRQSMASIPASAGWRTCGLPLADLERLQLNIVLSHAAGTGRPLPKPIARLMVALQLASLS